MATINLTIVVEDISTVLTLFDVIKVYRSTTGVGGPYSEISGVGTRPALSAGQSVYSYVDTSGDASYYYKTSYFNETSLLESSLSEAIQGDQDTRYVTIDDIRAEGIYVSQASDDQVLFLIDTWQRVIENITRQFFVAKEMTWDLDGNGSTLLQLPVPIVSVSALYINNNFTTEVDSTSYRVYNGRGDSGPDDRKNPRIRLVTGEESIFSGTGSVRRHGQVFEIGEQNIRVEGTFGYLEADGSTPAPIQYALRKLVSVSAARGPLGSAGAQAAGPVVEEETDRHRLEYSDAQNATKMWSVSGTGDAEIDAILAMYKGPMVVRAPRTGFRRFVGIGI